MFWQKSGALRLPRLHELRRIRIARVRAPRLFHEVEDTAGNHRVVEHEHAGPLQRIAQAAQPFARDRLALFLQLLKLLFQFFTEALFRLIQLAKLTR